MTSLGPSEVAIAGDAVEMAGVSDALEVAGVAEVAAAAVTSGIASVAVPAEAAVVAPQSRASARRVARVAVLAAVALALSYVETTIPLPLVFPGAKLGLANIAVLVALFAYDARMAVSVATVKVLAAGFLFGSPLMLAYSLGGTALAVAGMLLLKLVPGISVTLVSMVSAVLHNTGQVLVACALLGTPAVLLSLPPLALVALVTGALTGVVASAVLAEQTAGEGMPEGEAGDGGAVPCASDAAADGPSVCVSDAVSDAAADTSSTCAPDAAIDVPGAADSREPAAAPADRSCDPAAFGVYRPGMSLAHGLDPRVKIVFVILFFVAAFVASGPVSFALVAGVAVAAMACSGAGVRQALSWLKPFVGLFLFVAVFAVLFTRTGEVLWASGIVTVTTGGLAFAAASVARFSFMALGTSSLMATTSPEELTEGVGGLLAPLRRLGVRTDDAVLALSLTLQFVPVVAAEFGAAKAAHDERMAFEGVADDDVASGGAASGGVASDGVARGDVVRADVVHDGATADGVARDGVVHLDVARDGRDAQSGPRGPIAFARSMRSYGLAFAPAFANALRRADDCAAELELDPSGCAAVAPATRPLASVDRVVLAVSLALAAAVVVLALI